MKKPYFKSTFYSSILFYSRFNPRAVAVSFGAHDISYAQFATDIERATRRLHDLANPAAQRAIIHVAHPYLHWVLVIALGRLGIPSATVYDIAKPGLLDLISPDIVLTTDSARESDARFIQVTQEWLKPESDALAPFVDTDNSYDDPFRFVLSSGTTGVPKKILLTHGQFESRLRALATNSSLTGPSSRTLSLVGFDTIGGFQLPMATWSMGGGVVLRMPGEDAYRTIARQRVTYAFMSPVQLGSMLDVLPDGAWPVPGLTISVGGSVLPRAIAQRARQQLTPSLILVYGSTESGLVARTHTALAEKQAGATGWIVPGVDVEIVDATGTPVGEGVVGEVRIRSESCVTGYLDADSSTANDEEVFRDGWFYPGDAGILNDTNMLTIMGRTKELMNFGGVKVAPDAIEAALRECPGVMDIAAFALDVADGTDKPWVAVVHGQDYRQEALASRFKERFPELPSLAFSRIDSIPRNAMGKVMRKELCTLVKRAIKRNPATGLQ